MKISFTGYEESFKRIKKQVNFLTNYQLKQAAANAVNSTMIKARDGYIVEMKGIFDKPTPFITKTVLYKKATSEVLSGSVYPANEGRVAPAMVLKAQAHGGGRRLKRLEVFLKAKGFLPEGYQTTLPNKNRVDASIDRYGNIKGSWAKKIINDVLKKEEPVTKKRGRKSSKAFFVIRVGEKKKKIPAGVWYRDKTGLKPILLFFSNFNYRRILRTEYIVTKNNLSEMLQRRMRYEVRKSFEKINGVS